GEVDPAGEAALDVFVGRTPGKYPAHRGRLLRGRTRGVENLERRELLRRRRFPHDARVSLVTGGAAAEIDFADRLAGGKRRRGVGAQQGVVRLEYLRIQPRPDHVLLIDLPV